MQETRNNCFGSKMGITTLRQAKRGKHECRNPYVAVIFRHLYCTCFRVKKGYAMYFQPETIVASFLRLMVLLFKVLFNDILLNISIT